MIMEGYVHEQDGKKWNRYWYVIKKDFALYKFKAHEVNIELANEVQLILAKQDIRAIETVPLPGYSVKGDRLCLTIQLIHHQTKKKKLNLTFKTDSEDDFDT